MRSHIACMLALAILCATHCAADCLRKPKAADAAKRRPEPITVPVPVLLAHAIHRVQPVFPEEARTAKIDGAVVIALEVDHDGYVTETRPLSGLPILQPAAIAAVQQWRFESFCIKGLPYTVRSAIEFQFRWRGDGSRLAEP